MPPVTRQYRWYVLYTRSKHEKAAERYLKSCGIEVFLPMRRVQRNRTDRKIWIQEPVFRSYLFVRVSSREYDKALQSDSISRYVSVGGFPCFVPDEQIKAIREILNDSVDFEVTQDKFESGDQVTITSGALSGYLAEVVERLGRKSLILRIGCLDQAIVIICKCDYAQLGGWYN